MNNEEIEKKIHNLTQRVRALEVELGMPHTADTSDHSGGDGGDPIPGPGEGPGGHP